MGNTRRNKQHKLDGFVATKNPTIRTDTGQHLWSGYEGVESNVNSSRCTMFDGEASFWRSTGGR